jgi:dihydroorotate dehydrogenase (NAD+) catalytic subunit
MKQNTATIIAGIKLRNPVVTASGTFGYGDEVSDLCDVKSLGAIVTKTISIQPKAGNPAPRIAEVASGILNTIGLQNIGAEAFVSQKLPGLRKLNVPLIISVAGHTENEYLSVIDIISAESGIAAVELNLSCPNLQKRIVCQDEGLMNAIIKGACRRLGVPVIAKLSPQLTDIAYSANIALRSGAKALSLVNTFPAMAIDVRTWKPKLSTVTGGLSGPAVKPMALRAVWEVYRNHRCPIIGGGGISSGEDAVEFMLAGACAVSVGTASFVDPNAAPRVAAEIESYMKKYGIKKISDMVGMLKT